VKTIEFTPRLSIAEVPGFVEVLKINAATSWQEDGRTITLGRSAYISDYVTDENP
jgi:hypothetical protein